SVNNHSRRAHSGEHFWVKKGKKQMNASAEQPLLPKQSSSTPQLVWLSRFVVVQVIIAVIAVIAVSFAAFRIVPLVRKERELHEEVQKLQTRLQESTNLMKNVYDVTPMDAKAPYAERPDAGYLLTSVLEMRRDGVQWKVGGRN